jgi:hypothetical protein
MLTRVFGKLVKIFKSSFIGSTIQTPVNVLVYNLSAVL